MALSVDYAIRETSSNLWRNRMMTTAAVLTVAVSLSLVGAALLLKQGVALATARWRGGVGLSIFLNPDVSDSQQRAIKQELVVDPQVKTFYYLNHQASYREMQTLFRDQPDLVNSVTPGDLPPSFRVTLRDSSDAPSVGNAFAGQPGVKQVSFPGQEIQTMDNVTRVLQWVFFGVAIVLLISALVLILNTIRLAIFSRRREVAVMKLVGATNWFIRVPYMLEGLVQGVVGAFVAAWIVLGLNELLKYSVRHYHVNLLDSVVVTGHDVFGTEIIVLIIGTLVGAAGSYFAVRRHLEV